MPPEDMLRPAIHDFLCCDKVKSWIPAFAGRTGGRGCRALIRSFLGVASGS
jgi:hypothetical protein